MTEFDCPDCDEEEFGTIQDQNSAFCLDCGRYNGNRDGRELEHHEDRARRMQLLIREINKLNKNIKKDKEIEREERLLSLLSQEVASYFRWVGAEADREAMQQRQRYKPRDEIRRQGFRGEFP